MYGSQALYAYFAAQKFLNVPKSMLNVQNGLKKEHISIARALQFACTTLLAFS